ncbi:unnamed protein product [Peronospora effusa]|uniref:Mediator complex subunit 15 KIX domain-containing protein n=1 Tax=Peronospora effusa TaxID=542832 RepID=A0A3R7WSR9_9STRA|nr:hypothetical protein DD237_002736 [Peronospora effusa]CAI5704200.1 unnamed protein product [Peronospora effusa]
MDPHAVNAMGIQVGISMPMSSSIAGVNGSNPQAIAMGINGGIAMNGYVVPQQQQQQQQQQQEQQQQQQQMMMNMGQMNQMNMGSIAMKMNSNVMNSAAPPAATTGSGMQSNGADWRIQLTREHRANLIAKIYNEMVRVSADPVPGIKLWMNASWYELTLYKESRTQEEYINKIFTRLKSLRGQQTDMNAVMAAQTLPNQGMLSRLDFSYYNTLSINHRASASGAIGSQVEGFPGHAQYGGPAAHPGAQQAQPAKALAAGAGSVPANSAAHYGASTTPRAEKPEGAIPGDTPAEYWRQHAALKLKYYDDVEKVHSAFKKYVDHMKGHDETEQKKKLRYLLSYVQLCASILNEDKSTHAPRKIEELDKVYKYIVKIVNPYLKKLRTETDKRSFTPNAGRIPSGMNHSVATNPASSPPASAVGAAATSANTSSVPNGAMHMHRQQLGQPQLQPNLSLQQKQQQYLMQQRAQQMQQQQQRMQVQARQQQVMQQQHVMQQQKGATQQNQAQVSAQQANQANMQKLQQNGQPQQNLQQNQPQQCLAQHAQHAQQASNDQERPAQSQQLTSHQPQQPRQPPQAPQQMMQQQQQTHSQHKSQPQVPSSASTSRAEASSLSLDDPLYGGMDSSSLLLMPSNLGHSNSSSGFMNFPNDMSPTNFSSMDLLDMDGFMVHDGSNAGSGNSGHNHSHSSGGNNKSSGDGGDSDLMFMEAL